ncbi:MAG: hypothetical protein ACM3U1_02050 [Chloroflexota bacterium]
MTIRTLFALLLAAFVACQLSSFAETPKYYTHSLAAQLMTPEKQKAIDLWISYLYEPSEDKRKAMWDAAEVARFGDGYCMFNSLFASFGRETTLEYFTPYILKVEEQKDIFLITTMFTQFDFTPRSDSAYFNQNPISIVKVAVTKNGPGYRLKNVLDDETKYWKRVDIGKINYIVEPSIEIDSSECMKAVRFVDSLSLVWHGKPFDRKIDYYISNSIESINKLAGFEFSFVGGFGGMANPEANLLFSDKPIFNYRHELSHIVFNFPSDSVNRMLSEGMATYFGGMRDQSFAETKKDFSSKYYPLKSSDLDKIFDYAGATDFYAFSGLVVELIIQKKGFAGLRSLASTPRGDHSKGGGEVFLQHAESMLGINEQVLLDEINISLKEK